MHYRQNSAGLTAKRVALMQGGAMDSLRIPSEHDIDVPWFNQCFANNNIEAKVASFTAKRVGTGQIGKCVRYTFTYAEGGGEGPDSLVGKFPSDDESSRATGVMLQNFLKEVRFYQELQSQVFIRTPTCFFAEIVDQGPDFFLLLQDLAPAEQGDQLLGCTPAVAACALRELVGLHAPGWCNEGLRSLTWLRDEQTAPAIDTMDLYRLQLPGFVERFAPLVEADEIAIIQALGQAKQSPLSAQLPEVFSLIHVDYRLDNLLIQQTGDAYQVTAVDWQSITLGAPLNDVAYFVGAGLEPGVRRPAEEQLIRDYHQGLMDRGVQNFSWQQCWEGSD